MFPESLGADVAWSASGSWVGVQRKEVKDLLASVEDGRLGQQLVQLERCGVAALVVEGELRFTMDGELMGSRGSTRWTRRSLWGVLWSARRSGVWVDFTRDLTETIEWVGAFEAWTKKDKHTGLGGRPGPKGMWGTADSREWGVHVLQGFPGVGQELAGRMIDEFGGVPLRWTVGMKELTAVQGIGTKKAQGLMKALGVDNKGDE